MLTRRKRIRRSLFVAKSFKYVLADQYEDKGRTVKVFRHKENENEPHLFQESNNVSGKTLYYTENINRG